MLKKAKLIEEKKKKDPEFVEKLKAFSSKYMSSLIYLAVLFLITPPLFYSIQFVNNGLTSKKFTYDGYGTYDDFFRNEIEFPGGKDAPTLPINQRPLVQNITEAFKASLAKGFFTSLSTVDSIFGFIRQFLDFNHTLDSNLFYKDTPVSKIMKSVSRLSNERKPNGVLGQIVGAFMILVAPWIYLITLLITPIYPILTGLFTLFTTLNLRTYIKLIVMLGAVISAYISSYFLLIIPTIFLLFIPQIALGWFLCILGLIVLAISVGTPMLFILFRSLYTTIKIFGAVLWLPNFVNNFFMSKMNNAEKDKYEDIKLRGARYEYPAHAREFAGLYSAVFLFLTISAAAHTAFS